MAHFGMCVAAGNKTPTTFTLLICGTFGGNERAECKSLGPWSYQEVFMLVPKEHNRKLEERFQVGACFLNHFI